VCETSATLRLAYIHIYIFVYILNYMCTCIYISVCIFVYLGICVCVYTHELIVQIHNVHIYMCTYIRIYINMFRIYVDQGQFGDAGDGTSCENEFKMQTHKWEDYKGTRFYDGERALVIKRWLNRVDEDALGLTFEEWDPTENVDSSQMPVVMIINSSELRTAGLTLREVFPKELEAAARRRSTRVAGICQLEGMGPKRFILSVHDDIEFRSRCE